VFKCSKSRKTIKLSRHGYIKDTNKIIIMKGTFKNKNNMKNNALVIFSMILIIPALIFGCEKANDSKHNPPADHTISKDGFMHKSGIEQPLVNCVGCHGSDLKGGTVGVSCYECHGKKW
jgi:hypothetical protein